MSNHYETTYSCGHISQCRCSSPDKIIKTVDEVCHLCMNKENKQENFSGDIDPEKFYIVDNETYQLQSGQDSEFPDKESAQRDLDLASEEEKEELKVVPGFTLISKGIKNFSNENFSLSKSFINKVYSALDSGTSWDNLDYVKSVENILLKYVSMQELENSEDAVDIAISKLSPEDEEKLKDLVNNKNDHDGDENFSSKEIDPEKYYVVDLDEDDNIIQILFGPFDEKMKAHSKLVEKGGKYSEVLKGSTILKKPDQSYNKNFSQSNNNNNNMSSKTKNFSKEIDPEKYYLIETPGRTNDSSLYKIHSEYSTEDEALKHWDDINSESRRAVRKGSTLISKGIKNFSSSSSTENFSDIDPEKYYLWDDMSSKIVSYGPEKWFSDKSSADKARSLKVKELQSKKESGQIYVRKGSTLINQGIKNFSQSNNNNNMSSKTKNFSDDQATEVKELVADIQELPEAQQAAVVAQVEESHPEEVATEVAAIVNGESDGNVEILAEPASAISEIVDAVPTQENFSRRTLRRIGELTVNFSRKSKKSGTTKNFSESADEAGNGGLEQMVDILKESGCTLDELKDLLKKADSEGKNMSDESPEKKIEDLTAQITELPKEDQAALVAVVEDEQSPEAAAEITEIIEGKTDGDEVEILSPVAPEISETIENMSTRNFSLKQVKRTREIMANFSDEPVELGTQEGGDSVVVPTATDKLDDKPAEEVIQTDVTQTIAPVEKTANVSDDKAETVVDKVDKAEGEVLNASEEGGDKSKEEDGKETKKEEDLSLEELQDLLDKAVDSNDQDAIDKYEELIEKAQAKLDEKKDDDKSDDKEKEASEEEEEDDISDEQIQENFSRGESTTTSSYRSFLASQMPGFYKTPGK